MQASSVRCFVASTIACSSASASSSSGRAVAAVLSSASTRQKSWKRARQAARNDENSTFLDTASGQRLPNIKPVDPAKYLKTVKVDPEKPFDLAAFHPYLDIHPENYINANESTRIVMVNPTFPRPSPETIAFMKASSQDSSANSDPLAALAADASLRFGVKDLRQLHRYPLVVHRVVNMTSKGKMPSIYALVVVGNGKGLVGFGEGKDDTAPAASDKAFVQAVKNMDWVQRKDDRTTWASEMIGKWGSTTVELRSRPPGFGLRTSPIIHQIAKAAGISDLSAKIRGSRNGMNTVKATINLLHGGAAPVAMGDLSGHAKLARRFKGVGMRSATEIGLDLGRQAVELQ